MSYQDENNGFYHYSGDPYKMEQDGARQEPQRDSSGYEPSYQQPSYQQSYSYQTQQPKKKGRWKKITAAVLAGVLLCGAAFGVGFAAKNVFDGDDKIGSVGSNKVSGSTTIFYSDREGVEVQPAIVTGLKELSYTELYASNVNSCVSINVSTTQNIFGQTTQSASAGSGFIITADGYIVTNYHVINGGTTVKVTTYDGTEYDATVIGGEEEYDIAVVKIEAENLTPVVVGDSSTLQVGNEVAAIGNPLGELTFSMSEGIVSCVDRLINVDGTPFNMIQTTAAVNSGNSGGPLFNKYGEVIGIVSAKYSSSSSGASVEGLGFAIPINDVIAMIEDIMSNGYVTNKPFIGIVPGTFEQSMIPNSVVSEGVYVYSVEKGTAAEKAGILAGDIIVSIDGKEITSVEDLNAVKKSYSAGDTVTVEYYRSNEKHTTSLTFDVTPEDTTVQQPQQPQQQYPQQNPNNGGGYYDPWDFFDYYFGNGFGW